MSEEAEVKPLKYYALALEHLERKRRRPAGMKVYRAAIIGCGRAGSLFGRDHLRAHPCSLAGLFETHERFDLVGGCDVREDRRADFVKDRGITEENVFEDYREMFKVLRLDAVAIATYTESHEEITIAAARAGVKIILCEKPMALDISSADRMINACKEAGALLAIHHERRWSNVYRSVRKLIADGEIGEVRTIIGNVLTGAPHPDWHSNPAVSGGGPALHDGTHLFDVIPYLCGPIADVTGETERANPKLKVEDTARALLRLESGAVAFVECGGRRKYFNFELDIQGTKGRIIVGNAVRRLFTVAPSPRYEGFTEFSEKPFPPLLQPEYFPYILDEIVEAHETGRDSISSGEAGREALRNVLKVYESGALDFRKVFREKRGHSTFSSPSGNLPG